MTGSGQPGGQGDGEGTWIHIRAHPPEGPVVPGEPYAVMVTLVNDGPEVEQLTLDAAGPLAAWVLVEPPVVRLWPQGQGQIAVTVRLPSGPDPDAGPSALLLTAHTGDGQQVRTQVRVQVLAQVTVDLSPPRPHALESPRRARVDLDLTNRSNVPVQVHLQVTDREGRLGQQRPRSPLRLAAGESAGVRAVLVWKKLLWRGRSRPCDYVVTADIRPLVTGGPDAPVQPAPRTHTGVVVQAPVLRLWWLVLWGALMTVTWRSSGGWGWVLGQMTLAWTLLIAALVAHRLLVVRRANRRVRTTRRTGS